MDEHVSARHLGHLPWAGGSTLRPCSPGVEPDAATRILLAVAESVIANHWRASRNHQAAIRLPNTEYLLGTERLWIAHATSRRITRRDVDGLYGFEGRGMRRQKPSSEAEEMYLADVTLAARLEELLDAARKAEGSLHQAQAVRARDSELRSLAEDLDAALTAAMHAAYAAQRAEIGPRGYDDRIYRRKAMAKPSVHALTAEAEHLLTLRETHRISGIPAVAFESSPLPSSEPGEESVPGSEPSQDQPPQGIGPAPVTGAADEAPAVQVGAPTGNAAGAPQVEEPAGVAVASADKENVPASLNQAGSAQIVWPSDIASLVDRISRYTRRRGILVTALLDPFFKALLSLYKYDTTKSTEVNIPVFPAGLRWAYPLRLRLSFSGNEISLSVHFLWQWVEDIHGRLAPDRAGDQLYLRALSVLLDFYSGPRIVRKDLKASKAQILSLIAAFSILPYLLSLLFLPRRVIWIVLRSLATTMRTALRPIPALLAVLVIMFATGDAWRMFGVDAPPRFAILIGSLLTLSLASLLVAMRRSSVSWETLIGYPSGGQEVLRVWADSTPAKKLIALGVTPLLTLTSDATGTAVDNADHSGLRRNIVVIYATTMVVHLIAIAFWISIAFMIVGTIVVSRAMTMELSAVPAEVVFQFNLFGQEFALTRQLVLLSVTLGCIAALTFATSTLQSAEGRKAFADYALMDLRRSLGALSYYLGALGALLVELRDRGVIDELASIDKKSLNKLIALMSDMASSPVADPASDT